MWGVEPQTFRMQSGRSTTELHPLYVSSLVSIDICNSFCYDYFVVAKYWRCGGLNQRPSACETDALQLRYNPCSYSLLLPLIFVTHSVTITLLLQNVGDVGDRTPDLPHAKRTLYH